MLLRRLAYPNRLVDMRPFFRCSVEEISLICNTMLQEIFDLHHDKLENIFQPWVDHAHFAQVILSHGAALRNIWGFIDGTLKGMCRPGIGQRELYSGHKRHHGLKYQHIMCPNGLVCHAWGPYIGRRHDISMYVDSGVEEQLKKVLGNRGEQLAIYGDGGYAPRDWLRVPFKGFKTPEQQEFNVAMSNVRASVEWGFGKLSSNFAFVAFPQNQKVFLQPVGTYYLVASLLTNCHTCLYGSQVSQYFDCPPPSLKDYLSA